MIYLDNAATSAIKPETVYKTLDRYTRLHSANAGRGTNDESLFFRECDTRGAGYGRRAF